MRFDAQKDLSYYLVRWLTFGAVVGLFAPVVSHRAPGWGGKAQHLAMGLLFGAAFGYAFTYLQNRFNIRRDKKLTWGIAALIWTGFNIAFATMDFL